MKACGCVFPSEKRGRSAFVPHLFPPFTGMRSHHQPESIRRQWSQNLNPFPLQNTQRLIKPHTNFSCDTSWCICNKCPESSGFGKRRKDVQPCTLNIKYLNTFAFPLSSYLSHVICFLTMWTLFEVLSSPGCVFTEPRGHRWGLWVLLKELGGRLFPLFFLERNYTHIILHILQFWFCDLELTSIFEENTKKKERKRI